MTRGRAARLGGAACALVVLVLLASLASCDRLVRNLGGGVGPEAGLLRGKQPVESRGVTHLLRLTDGIAAVPGDSWRTDLTAVLSSADAFVTWDLGGETPVRCALFDADGNDSYALSVSSDGKTFAPLWTAAPDEDAGQQLRAGRDLRGAGRYLRLTAAGGDGRWSVSEVSAWSECPKTWPPLAMQKGTPDDESLRLKLWAFAALALAYVLAYRKRAPDWVKLLGVAPAGVGVALAVELAQTWPPSSELALRMGVVVGALGVALGARRLLARKPPPGAVVLVLLAATVAGTACNRRSSLDPDAGSTCDGTPAQGWQGLAASPFGGKVASDAQGRLFLAEPFEDPSAPSRTRVSRLDDAGVFVWSQSIDGAPAALAASGSGGVLAATTVDGTAQTDPAVRAGGTPRKRVALTRVDASGRLGAPTTFGDDGGDLAVSFVSESASGEVVVGGTFAPDTPASDFNPPFQFSFFVARLSASGAVVWERHVDDQGIAEAFVVDAAGRVGVLVWVRAQSAAVDGLDLKTVAQGTALVWFDAMTGRAVEAHDLTQVALPSDVETDTEEPSDALVDSAGQVYVAGSIDREALGAPITSQLFVSAFDAAGTRLWSQPFVLGSETGAAFLGADPCGGITFVGDAQNQAMGFLVARLSRDGQTEYEGTITTSAGQQVVSAAPTHGGVYVTGASGDDNNEAGFVALVGF